MTWLSLSDDCLLAFAFVFPVYSVLKWKESGILWGTLANWGSLVLAGAMLTLFDPSRRNPFNGLFDVFWFLFGWPLGLAYCYLIVLIRMVVRSVRGTKT